MTGRNCMLSRMHSYPNVLENRRKNSFLLAVREISIDISHAKAWAKKKQLQKNFVIAVLEKKIMRTDVRASSKVFMPYYNDSTRNNPSVQNSRGPHLKIQSKVWR